MVFSHIYYLMDRKCWLSWTRSMPTFSMTVRMPSFPFIRKMISKVYTTRKPISSEPREPLNKSSAASSWRFHQRFPCFPCGRWVRMICFLWQVRGNPFPKWCHQAAESKATRPRNWCSFVYGAFDICHSVQFWDWKSPLPVVRFPADEAIQPRNHFVWIEIEELLC